MDKMAKIKLLEAHMKRLVPGEKENYGVCRKIRRNIRNLQKELTFRT